MNLYIDDLFNRYCYKTKRYISYQLASGEYPYDSFDEIEDENLQYRAEYIDLCLEGAVNIWNESGFSEDLTILYEDKYSCHNKNEKEFIESTLNLLDYQQYSFKWNDEQEIYKGIRYIWKTDKINIKKLFKKIILSDLGEDTELDCAVYIIDNKTENVFFIYDDRGIDIFFS